MAKKKIEATVPQYYVFCMEDKIGSGCLEAAKALAEDCAGNSEGEVFCIVKVIGICETEAVPTWKYDEEYKKLGE